MATVEQLLVEIKTVFDPTGARQAQQSVNQLSQQQQTANRLLTAMMQQQAHTLENYKRAVGGIQQLGGTAPTLGPGAFGIQAGAAGGGTATATASILERGARHATAYAAGLYVLHRALQALIDVTTKAVDAERLHQRMMASTIPMYGSYTGEIKNLDGAMNTADQSAARLMATLGKAVGPTATTGANTENSILKFINTALDDTSKKLNEIGQNPVLDKILTLGKIAALGVPPLGIPAAAAVTALQQLGQTQAAQAADRTNLRLRQLNATENTPPVLSDKDRTDLQARLNWQDQITAAATALNDAQNVQIGLQHQAVNLSAQEAAIRLSMLPTQERLAALQRDATENQLRARQAALPASEALEDVQYMEQRLRLQLQSRGLLSPEERAGARRELRGLARAEPAIALGALDAGRPVTVAGRAATRAELEAQLQNVALQRQLAPLQGAQLQDQLVAAIVAANLQAAKEYQQELTVVVTIQSTGDQFVHQSHNALLAAMNSASVNLAGAA